MDVLLESPPAGPPAGLAPPRRWPARLIAAALLGTALALDRSAPLVIPVLFLLIVPFERLFPRHRQRVRRPDLRTDIAFGVATPALAAISVGVGIVIGLSSLAWLPGLALRPLVMAMPSAVRAVVGVLLFDLTIYWLHRFSHEVPFLWRFHAVHHSTRQLDWVSGLRNHPFDGAFLAPPIVLLAAAGFRAEYVGVLTIIQIVTGLFLHANVRWRWRPLQRIVITPEFHHWHHTNELDARHTNYSVFLPVWDIVFGTYFMPRDRRPQHYGIDEPMPTGMVNQLRYPFCGLPPVRQAIRFAARHPLQAARRVLRSVRRGVRQMWTAARRPTRSFVHSER